MAKKPESRLQRRIRDRLEKEVGGWWFKVHGGPFQEEGIPDLMGCVERLFFSFEVKRPKKGKASDVQLEVMSDIRRKGKGVSCIVESAAQAVAIVQQTLEKFYGNEKQSRSKRLLRKSRR